MRRRGFLQLAGAAVLGVLASRVPVFSADTMALAEVVGEPVSMWVYPVHYALPIHLEGVLRDRTITVPAFTLPSNIDSTWTVGFPLDQPNPARDAYLAEVDAIEERQRQWYGYHRPSSSYGGLKGKWL